MKENKLEKQIDVLVQQNNEFLNFIIEAAKRNDQNTLNDIKNLTAKIERNRNYIEALEIATNMLK